MPLPTAREKEQQIEDPFDGLHSSDLEPHVTTLLQYKSFLSDGQLSRLQSLHKGDEEEQPRAVYGADFDLADEVNQQIVAVRAIRDNIIDRQGRLRGDVALREAKEAVAASSTMLSNLMKYHKEIINMNRQRKLESAVIETLMEVDPSLKDKVVSLLERKLEVV